ncbi:flippase [Candidatus Uhrbacteria bacterium]|nr:flippase [Candidatus Uhrbacteria bacterium]
MASLTRLIARNTAIHTTGKLLNLPIVLIVVAVMTRALGPEGFGGYSTIIAFLQFFGITANFGLLLTANRLLGETATETARSRLMSNLFTLRFFSSLIFLSLAPLLALLFPYPAAVKQGMFITALSFLAISLAETLVPVFQRELRMGYVAAAELAARFTLLAGVALTAYFHAGLLWFLAAIVAGSAMQFLMMRIFTGKFIELHLAFDWTVWRKIIGISWPIGLSILFNLIYLKADTIILSALRTQTEVGFYGAAYRVLDQLTGFATMFIGLLMVPLTAAWVARDQTRFRRIYQRAFDAYAVVAWPLLVGAWLIGERLMIFVAGSAFAASGKILAILMIGMTFVFFSTLFGHVVVVVDKQRPMIWGYVITAVAGFSAYALTIPRFGIWGAAWSTVGAEALIMILTAAMVWRATRAPLELSIFSKGLLASIILGLFLYFTRVFPLAIPLFGGALIYFAALYAFGGIKKELIRDIVSLRNSPS